MLRTHRARRAAAGLLLALVAAAAGCGGTEVAPSIAAPTDSSDPQTNRPRAPTRVELRFANGSVVGGVSRHQVPLGTTVEIQVSSDVADQVHVHGYDELVDVPAGGTASLTLVATVAGVFEIEMEARHKQLARLEVR